MAILTELSPAEVREAANAFGIDARSSSGVLAGSVNTNFDIVDGGGARWFLRVYEEQGAEGARRETRLLARLASDGIPTPAPRPVASADGYVTFVRGKPACLFPFVPGVHRCQRAVTVEDASAVGAALAAVHLAGERFDPAEGLTGPSRFSLEAVARRLASIRTDAPDEVRRDARLLAGRVDDLLALQPSASAIPLVHGDLFRDNVLFDDALEATRASPILLDFESASIGYAAYDLSVTLLAWCFGDALSPELARSFVAGYLAVRALREAEVADLPRSAQAACLRFAATRITDYELRPRGVGVYKDYRRWLARLAAVDASFGLRGATPDSTLRDIWPT